MQESQAGKQEGTEPAKEIEEDLGGSLGQLLLFPLLFCKGALCTSNNNDGLYYTNEFSNH